MTQREEGNNMANCSVENNAVVSDLQGYNPEVFGLISSTVNKFITQLVKHYYRLVLLI